jgi:hypothetical protein
MEATDTHSHAVAEYLHRRYTNCTVAYLDVWFLFARKYRLTPFSRNFTNKASPSTSAQLSSHLAANTPTPSD